MRRLYRTARGKGKRRARLSRRGIRGAGADHLRVIVDGERKGDEILVKSVSLD